MLPTLVEVGGKCFSLIKLTHTDLPCVSCVNGATMSIPDSAMIGVDGKTRAVRILEVIMNQEDRSTESRLLAALAHGSSIFMGLGILVGVVVYTSQREKSRYAAFQGLQAAVFQLMNLVIIIGMWIIWTVLYVLSLIPLIAQAETNPDAEPSAFFWIMLISMLIPLIYMALASLYGLWGALGTWQGKDFKYPIIGDWLEKRGLWRPVQARHSRTS